jgi:hypothetical protein
VTKLLAPRDGRIQSDGQPAERVAIITQALAVVSPSRDRRGDIRRHPQKIAELLGWERGESLESAPLHT